MLDKLTSGVFDRTIVREFNVNESAVSIKVFLNRYTHKMGLYIDSSIN